MKKVFFAIFPVLLFAAVQLRAQSKEEKQVAAAVENFRQTLISGDRAALQTLASDKLSYGHSGGKIEDKATFVDQIASGRSDFVTCEFSNQSISVSGDVAIVRHRLDAKTNDGGKPGAVSLNILLVFQKQKGKWILLARQAIKIPQP